MPDNPSESSSLPAQIARIVESGLCIGCGLCEAIVGRDALRMVMTPQGRERPVAVGAVDAAAERLILAVCPGVRVEAPAPVQAPGFSFDSVWGNAATMAYAWAADAEVRHRGATGGVLSALAIHLLESREVDFIAHVRMSPAQPTRSEASVSRSRGEVLAAAGSRYGPAAALRDFLALLDLGRPFAFIGKPCDVSALRTLARHDERVSRQVRYMLTMVCGGASELGLTTDLLSGWQISEHEVALMRYRGYGNPGPMRAETHDGRAFEVGYNDVWGDVSKWRLQFRCKVCPDPIGEAADIAACDVWPGGSPVGEDEGINGVLARTPSGEALLRSAVEAGALVLGDAYGFRDMDDFQPHQIEKRLALPGRLAALAIAGAAPLHFDGYRLDERAREAGIDAGVEELQGTLRRWAEGKVTEPSPRPE